MKTYFQKDGITIYHGDCREILPGLDCELILTDPPYGINLPARDKDRGRSNAAVSKNHAPIRGDDQPFDPRWLIELGKPTLMFGANYFGHLLPPSSGWIVWDKMRPETLDQATAELAWSNFIKGVRVFRYLWNGMIRAGDEALEHPAMKPSALWRWILSLKWTPEGTICDPYMGSGTTLRAAMDRGVKAIGIELEERYCEIAARRMEQNVLALDYA